MPVPPQPLSFHAFATLCQELKKEPGRLNKIDILAHTLSTLSRTDIAPCVYLIRGAPFPEWSQEKLGIGPNLLYESIAYTSGKQRDEVIKRLNTVGDIGTAVEELLFNKSQTSFLTTELTLHEVYTNLVTLARSSGTKSQREKMRVVQGLLSQMSPLEGKYFAGILLGDVRIGVGEGTVRDALAKAFGIDGNLIDHAFQMRNDLGEVALLCLDGEEALRDVTLTIYQPVRMMLARQGSIADVLSAAAKHEKEAEKADSANEVNEAKPGDSESEKTGSGAVAVEYKYDGARFQFHLGAKGCKIYSRRLEDVTDSLPDIAQALQEACNDEVILDGEAVAIDATGRPLPFQTVLKRFRRKHAVTKAAEEVKLVPRIFDILYHNNTLLTTLPCSERRHILEKVLKDHITPRIISDTEQVIEQYYHEALDNGHEGVMLKLLDSAYTPGVRGKDWVKIKPQPDSLDLIVIGAEWGEGKRGKVFGSFLVACLDDSLSVQDKNEQFTPFTEEFMDELIPISRVATGFSDQDLEEIYAETKDQIIREDKKSVFFEPQLVFEVGYSEIQKSSAYQGGFALRFPRLLKIRRDKGIFDVNSLSDIKERYEDQVSQKETQDSKKE